MGAALNVLGQAQIGRMAGGIAVLGDMLELGPTGPALQQPRRSHQVQHIDLVYCCGLFL